MEKHAALHKGGQSCQARQGEVSEEHACHTGGAHAKDNESVSEPA